MPLNQPDFPVQFLVSREIARRQKVDDSTATRLALTSALVAPGFLGAIVARQLAIREAPPPAPVVATPPSGGEPGTTPAPPTPRSPALAQLDRIAQDLQSINAKLDKEGSDFVAQAERLQQQADRARQERTEIMRRLCQSVGAIAAEGSSRESPPQPKTVAYEGKKSDPKT